MLHMEQPTTPIFLLLPAGVHGSPSVAGTPRTGPTFGCCPAMLSPNAESSVYVYLT